MAEPTFRKSSYSADNGCVELADLGEGIVGVRDSKLGDASPVLRFTRSEVAAWLAGTKAAEFDDLA
jgi:hypothetical protein